MNSSTIFGWSLFVGLAFFCGAWLVASSWDVEHLKNILAECQKDLPRSQTCELVAVIKE